MSLAFDETGRPFIILREQGKKKRVKGAEAHKVGQLHSTKSARLIMPKHVTSCTSNIAIMQLHYFAPFEYDWCICALSVLYMLFLMLIFVQINILAARTVASLLKTSLGPKGMDKMLVSPDGEVIITNDGATILEKMEVSQVDLLSIWIISFGKPD